MIYKMHQRSALLSHKLCSSCNNILAILRISSSYACTRYAQIKLTCWKCRLVVIEAPINKQMIYEKSQNIQNLIREKYYYKRKYTLLCPLSFRRIDDQLNTYTSKRKSFANCNTFTTTAVHRVISDIMILSI